MPSQTVRHAEELRHFRTSNMWRTPPFQSSQEHEKFAHGPMRIGLTFDPQSAPKVDRGSYAISAATYSGLQRCTGAMLDTERGQYSEPGHNAV
jgi:hypothetical protein